MPLRWVALAAVLAVASSLLLLQGAGGSPATGSRLATSSWDEIARAARGEEVRLWMWGGEEPLNRYLDTEVAQRARAAGVELVRVPVDDTATVLNRLASEHDAGVGSGSVDLVWVNGKNFAQGKEAGLWLERWTDLVPASRYLDPDDETLRSDFGVPVEGQELPWSRAAFVFAHDAELLPEPPRTLTALVDWIRDHPGRFTYPSPPDFTGSAFVRLVVRQLGEDEAFRLLAELEPLLWRGGRDHPQDAAALDRLFADGELDLTMSYNPNFVSAGVAAGRFPPSVRPFLLDGATLQNVSFLAIPANAPHPEAAAVVADLLLHPELQALKESLVGIPTVLDRERLGAAGRAFDAIGPSPHRLDDLGTPIEELPADRVVALDRRWLREVAR